MKHFEDSQCKQQISFEDFAKLELRVGEVVAAQEVEGSEKLVEMMVDFGPEIGKRTIYAGIKKWYSPEKLVSRRLAFVVNLAPKTFRFRDREYVSEGMMLAAGGDEATLYKFDKKLEPGAIIR